MAGKKRMGYEGIIYYGPAGSTATTQLTNSRGITIGRPNATSSSKVPRGDSSAPPIATFRTTERSLDLEVTLANVQGDSALEAMRTAVANATPIAIRGKDHSAGKGPDADFNVALSEEQPLDNEQEIRFTLTLNDELRDPLLYV